MSETSAQPIQPGQRVRIHQRIERREGDWEKAIEGVVVEVASQKTGSWYATGLEDKLWLNRIRIRKDDGELTLLVVEPATRVEILANP